MHSSLSPSLLHFTACPVSPLRDPLPVHIRVKWELEVKVSVLGSAESWSSYQEEMVGECLAIVMKRVFFWCQPCIDKGQSFRLCLYIWKYDCRLGVFCLCFTKFLKNDLHVNQKYFKYIMSCRQLFSKKQLVLLSKSNWEPCVFSVVFVWLFSIILIT